MTVELTKQVKAFDGFVNFYRHDSKACHSPMQFAVYLPPQATDNSPVPVLYWLSGLTCTHENFINKSGALKKASELGLALVSPDTSPRNTDTPGEDDEWDFGTGAGFYVNATQAPWNRHYQMYDYIADELIQVVGDNCPVDNHRKAISGHSMGGHGALVIGLNNPQSFHAISAFAPMSSPTHCPWGQKAFSRYLGDDQQHWQAYDASYLLEHGQSDVPVLVDQGDADQFLQDQLKPELLQKAADNNHYPLTLRHQPGYDHSYFFISTFIDEHLDFHLRHIAQ